MSESRRKIYPSSLRELESLLETATRPGTRARLQARIDDRRHHNAKKSARLKDAHRARTPEEVARARAEKHPSGLKTCRKCGQALPFAAFGDCPTATDGLWSSCAPCTERAKAEGAES